MVEPIDIPDATLEPERYKQALLDLLGERDPLEFIGETVARVRGLCEGVADEVLYAPPGAGEWSVAEVVGHLSDVDIIYGFRWRLVLTEQDPVYPGYEEKRWTPLPHLPFWQCLGAWEGLRASNLLLMCDVPRDEWARTGVHSQQGPETFDEMVRKVAAHDIAHINQIERALQALA